MLELTVDQLQAMLQEQKRETADYITRNLSVYSFYNGNAFDLDVAKHEMKSECMKSDFPNDFNVLKKYIKQS